MLFLSLHRALRAEGQHALQDAGMFQFRDGTGRTMGGARGAAGFARRELAARVATGEVRSSCMPSQVHRPDNSSATSGTSSGPWPCGSGSRGGASRDSCERSSAAGALRPDCACSWACHCAESACSGTAASNASHSNRPATSAHGKEAATRGSELCLNGLALAMR